MYVSSICLFYQASWEFLTLGLCYAVLSRVQVFETPWTVAYQTPMSVEFSRQEYWSGLPFPTLGDHPNSGIEPVPLASPALARFFSIEPPRKPSYLPTTL